MVGEYLDKITPSGDVNNNNSNGYEKTSRTHDDIRVIKVRPKRIRIYRKTMEKESMWSDSTKSTTNWNAKTVNKRGQDQDLVESY